MNLIPTTPGPAPNYWCTWNLQEAVSNQSKGTVNVRNVLSEEFLLGPSGWAKKMFPQIRGDLILLLDDGWDIPLIPGCDKKSNDDMMKQYISSFILNPSKWPNYTGNPAERLSHLNHEIKKEGWKSIGLWVAAVEAASLKFGWPLFRSSYWRERMDWCRQAKVTYWKVDWGLKCNLKIFRKNLTKMGRKFHPTLVIEHAHCTGAFNNKEGNGRVSDDYLTHTLAYMEFSDVVRLYDINFELGKATMLDRLAEVLKPFTQFPPDPSVRYKIKTDPILHTEDELYMAAAFGCTMGIMRHPLQGPHVKLHEAVRAIKWQRIAPPFGIKQAPVIISDHVLWDSRFFSPGESIKQGAPAAMTRGLPLPDFVDHADSTSAHLGLQNIPFIIASRNPNGAIGIATLGRIQGKENYYTPKVAVTLQIPSWTSPIGIFGEYSSLTLQSSTPCDASQIWAQDLGADLAIDVTKEIQREANRISLPGELIHRIGTQTNPPEDPSEPGLVLSFK
jgi:hypothetical protein